MSWFNGYTKYFVKIPLDDNALLKEKQSTILKGKNPTHEAHFTLAVIHVAPDTICTDYLKSTAFTEDMANIYKGPTQIEIKSVQKAIMGVKPECYALCFDTNNAYTTLAKEFRSSVCYFMMEKFNLTYENELINNEYDYMTLFHEGKVVMRIPSGKDPICHVTIMTSFDLKRCNKQLHKEFDESNDKLALFGHHFGAFSPKSISLKPSVLISCK